MDNPVQNVARLGIVALAALRVSRFFTSDSLGEWLIVGPAKRWAVRDVIAPDDSSDEHKVDIAERKRIALELEGIEERDQLIEYGANGPYASKRARLVKGLDCPFCVGFWGGVLILLGEVLTRTRLLRWARPLWTFGLSTLALNEVVGHVSSRIDA